MGYMTTNDITLTSNHSSLYSPSLLTQDLEDIKNKVTNLSVAAGFEPDTPPFFFYDLVEPGTAILHNEYYPLGEVLSLFYGGLVINIYTVYR